MKLIDLLRLVYEKKAPKRILYKYCEYEFDEKLNDYRNSDNLKLFMYLFENEIEALNKEIKIIEDKTKKIKKIKFPENWNEHRNMTFEEFRKAYKINFEISANTINEIIDNLNYLLEKSDKE